MILGTCNFGRNYNNSFLEKKEVFKVLEYYEKNGGDMLDTAYNYKPALDYIIEYGWKHKLIIKIWGDYELLEIFDKLPIRHIYCLMIRDVFNKDLLDLLHEYKKNGIIEKVGASIYYPNELIQNVNCYSLPNDYVFDDYLPTLILSNDVYYRSNYNLFHNNSNIHESLKDRVAYLKTFQRDDLDHKIDFIVGVDNIEQLQQDFELFDNVINPLSYDNRSY